MLEAATLGVSAIKEPGHNKRAPRVDIRRPAVLVDASGHHCDVTFLDVSSGGFRLGTSHPLKIGEFVTLGAERDVTFAAQIRWVLGNEAGGVFLDPVDQDWLDGARTTDE
ncbi:MAG: PilZ domain-containing protein [Sphingomicrobium sp.]